MKNFRHLLLFFLAITALFVFAACGEGEAPNGGQEQNDSPTHGHTPKSAVQENYTSATCTEGAWYDSVVYCETCKIELSRNKFTVSDPLGHDEVRHEAKAPTCTEIGWDAYVACSRCDHTTYNELAVLNHTPSGAKQENYTSATCTEGAWYDSVTYCTDCGKELERNKFTVSDPLGHDEATRVENRIEPTCTTDGSYDSVVYCSVCNDEISRTPKTITKLGHKAKSAVEENRVEATCTKDGSYESVVYCSVCNDEISRTKNQLDATYAHKMSDGKCTDCGLPESSKGLIFSLNSDEKSYTVTGVGSCTDTDIVIGVYNNLSVTHIGKLAFPSCTSLTSVAIGNSVTYIGDAAFYGCTSLTSVVIPDSVTYIGDYAFSECASLTNIEVDEVNENYKSVDGNLYTKDGKTLIQYAIGKTSESFTIPIGVTSIGDAAFYGCTSLESVVIPDSVTSIGYSAFSYCTSLESIEIDEANENYKSIDGNLYSKDGKTLIQYSVGKTESDFIIPWTVTSIGEWAFADCTSLTSVVIGNGVTSIGDAAFYGCTSLTSIAIPDSVTSIGEWAFADCTSITSVVIPNGVTSIGDHAFYCCDSLTSVVIGNGVTSIGEWAFADCTSITSVVIPNGVTSIGDHAFRCCYRLVEVYNLSSLNIIKGDSSVAYYALNVYTSLDTPSKVRLTDDGFVFYEDGDLCYLLGYKGNETDIVLPTSCNGKNYEIYKYAFYYCTSLTSVVIGNGVTSIGDWAFYYCTSLTSAVIGDSVTSIGDFAFSYCSSLTSVVIGNSVTSIGSYAFHDCTSLESVVIGNSVTSICHGAFDSCYKLVEVYNLSSLNIIKGDSSVAYYALNVYTSLDTPSKVRLTDDGFVFYEDGDLCYLLGYKENKTDIVLPISCNGKNYEIYKYAFYECTSLTSVVIPDSVTSIGEGAFSNCTSLKYNEYDNAYYLGNDKNPYLLLVKAKNESITSVNIHESTRFIHSDAFYECTSLTSAVIGDSVTSIGDFAFSYCSSLMSIKYRGTKEQWNAISMGNWNFHIYSYTIIYDYEGE